MARSLKTLSPVVSVSKPRISSGTRKYFFGTLPLFQSLVTRANALVPALGGTICHTWVMSFREARPLSAS
jgi:hypothetical protein